MKGPLEAPLQIGEHRWRNRLLALAVVAVLEARVVGRLPTGAR